MKYINVIKSRKETLLELLECIEEHDLTKSYEIKGLIHNKLEEINNILGEGNE